MEADGRKKLQGFCREGCAQVGAPYSPLLNRLSSGQTSEFSLNVAYMKYCVSTIICVRTLHYVSCPCITLPYVALRFIKIHKLHWFHIILYTLYLTHTYWIYNYIYIFINIYIYTHYTCIMYLYWIVFNIFNIIYVYISDTYATCSDAWHCQPCQVASILDVDAGHARSWLPWVLLAQAWPSSLALWGPAWTLSLYNHQELGFHIKNADFTRKNEVKTPWKRSKILRMSTKNRSVARLVARTLDYYSRRWWRMELMVMVIVAGVWVVCNVVPVLLVDHVRCRGAPSGKHTKNAGKSTISMAIFNSKLSVYQRVVAWQSDLEILPQALEVKLPWVPVPAKRRPSIHISGSCIQVLQRHGTKILRKYQLLFKFSVVTLHRFLWAAMPLLMRSKRWYQREGFAAWSSKVRSCRDLPLSKKKAFKMVIFWQLL